MPSFRVARLPVRHVRRRVWARVLVPGLFLALVGASALAFWSANGAGSGNGSSGSTAAVTLSPGVAAADLRPGGKGDVVLQVTNPNSSAAEIGSLALDVSQGDAGYAVDAVHTGCAFAVLDYTSQTNGGAGWTVPAGSGDDDGTLAITLSDAVEMDEDATDACQGAGLTVYLTVRP